MERSDSPPDSSLAVVPISVEGPYGPIRLKWHKLRTRYSEAPFKLSNFALGWQLGASLEVDILARADAHFIVAHDATLGPATTGAGRIASLPHTRWPGSSTTTALGSPISSALLLANRCAMRRPAGSGAS
jgi:hypothetical protein